MRARFILFTGAVLAAVPFLLAQAPPDKFPLEALHIQGNERISVERITAASGLKVGALVAKVDFDQARERLLATGAFDKVGYSFKPSADDKGFDLTLDIIEIEQLYPYRFEELPASDEALRAALRKQEPVLGDLIPATPDVLNRYTAAIRQFLGGKLEARGAVSADDPKALAIVFRPVAPRSNVAEVRFAGNSPAILPLLLQRIAPVAIGTPYSEPLIRQMLDSTIRDIYDERGRVRVAFPKITTEKAATNDGVVVTVTVEEGPPFKLGTVKLAGLPETQIEQLEKTTDWRKGELVNFAAVDKETAKIRQKVRATGYLQVQTRIARDIHDQDRTVDLVVNVEPGPQFLFGKLDIQGLDIISEPVIRKMWNLEAGKPFPEGFADAFLNRVREADLFDNLGKTRAETHIHQEERTVDVTLFFAGMGAERKPADRPKR